MELAILATWIDTLRQRCEECAVPLSACELSRNLARVDAGDPCAQTARDHLLSQQISRNSPYRENRLKTGPGKLVHSIRANLLQEQVTERDPRKSLRNRPCIHRRHSLLIDRIGAGKRQINLPQRQIGELCLTNQKRFPESVDRHAPGPLIYGGYKRRHIKLCARPQQMKRPCGVLAAAPAQKSLFHPSITPHVEQRDTIKPMPPLVLPFSREHLRPGDRVCAATSGGADSVALLLALHAANRQPREALGVVLSAVHVHHNLRATEADADADFVADLCCRLDIPLHQISVDVSSHIERTGETLEEAARNLRYGAFHDLMSSGQIDAVLTAHTLDDQAETVLMKLLRGAWTDGLSAIHPVILSTKEKPGKIIRPLLCTRRAEIEAYLREQSQPWREDSSNADTHHTRNRIRHELMPNLRTYSPNLDQALANIAELAREEESRWQAELGRLLPQIVLPGKPVRGGGRAVGTAPGESSLAIEIERLRSFDVALRRRVLRAAARNLGARLSFEETGRILALCGFQSHPTVTTRIGATVQLSQYLRAERSIRELRLFRQVP